MHCKQQTSPAPCRRGGFLVVAIGRLAERDGAGEKAAPGARDRPKLLMPFRAPGAGGRRRGAGQWPLGRPVRGVDLAPTRCLRHHRGTLAAPIDLADRTVWGHLDDHVALTGSQADPGVDALPLYIPPLVRRMKRSAREERDMIELLFVRQEPNGDLRMWSPVEIPYGDGGRGTGTTPRTGRRARARPPNRADPTRHMCRVGARARRAPAGCFTCVVSSGAGHMCPTDTRVVSPGSDLTKLASAAPGNVGLSVHRCRVRQPAATAS